MLYCKAPFGSFVLRGSKFGCCCSTTLKKESNANISYNTKYINDIREGILSGDILDICKICGSQDSYDSISDNIVRKNIESYIMYNNVNIVESIQISVGNTCNNLCMTCSSINNMLFDKNKIYKLEDFDLSHIDISYTKHVKHISFIGGETLLYADKIINILEMFDNLNTVSIVTNGSILSKNLIEYFDKNKDIQVSLILSVDGYKELHENIRTLSIYNNVIDNINAYSKSNANIIINITYSILNCLDLLRTLKELDKRLSGDISIMLVQLLNPSMLSVKNLPNDIKSQALKILNDSCNIKYLNLTINSASYKTIVELLSSNNNIYIDGNIVKEKILLFDKKYNSNSIDFINNKILSMGSNNIEYSYYENNKDNSFEYEWWDVSK